MKKLIIIYIFMSFFVSPMFAGRGLDISGQKPISTPFIEGVYRALIIGNNDYQDPEGIWKPLKTAVVDAESISKVLSEDFGFSKITLLKNATRRDILNGMKRLAKETKNNDSVLVYYAGHGYLNKETKEGFWIPVDAEGKDDSTYVSNARIKSRLSLIAENAKHTLLVSDSCFSGALLREGNRGVDLQDKNQRYYEKASRKKSVQILAAGGLEFVDDNYKNSGHSPFTFYFLSQLEHNNDQYYSTSDLSSEVTRSVSNNVQQTPEKGILHQAGHDGGEFFFVRSNFTSPSSSSKQTPKKIRTIDEEEEFWNTIKNSTYIEDIQAYLTDFPKGRFIRIAKIKIRQLKRNQKKPLLVAGGSVQTEEVGDGTVNVTSQPSNAKILIGNVYQGTSPVSFELKPGKYSIRAKKKGYKPESKNIEVKSNKRIKLSFILDKFGGSIWIRSNPDSAEIYVGNQYRGDTPITLKGLDKGYYKLNIKKEGYQDWKKTLYIANGKESNVYANLDKKKAVRTNIVRFRTADYSRGVTGPYFKKLAKAFNASQHGIEVVIEHIAWLDMMQKLNSELQAGTQPDISIVATRWLIDFQKDDVLAPLEDLIHPDFEATFVPSFLGIQKYKGHLFALPVAASARAMFYNETLMKKANAKVPTTWAETLAVARKIDALGSDISGIAIQGAEIDAEAYYFYSLWTHGGDLFNADGSSAIASSAAIKAANVMNSFVKAGVAQKGVNSYSRGKCEEAFRTGKIGIILTGPWFNNAIKKDGAKGVKYGIAPLPKGTVSATYGVTDSLVMFKDSKVKESAMKFLEFAFNHENRVQFNRNEGFVPVINSVINDPVFTSNKRLAPFLEMGKVAKFVPLVPRWEEMADHIKTAMQDVYAGTKSAKVALTGAAIKINRMMKNY
jgi:multiple sugar transport system substrate-binding protein